MMNWTAIRFTLVPALLLCWQSLACGQVQFLAAVPGSGIAEDVVPAQAVDLQPVLPSPAEEGTIMTDAPLSPEPTPIQDLPADGQLEMLTHGDAFEGAFTDDLEYEVSDCSPTPFYSTGTLYSRGKWYSQTELVVMLRGEVEERVIAREITVVQFNSGPLPVPIGRNLNSMSAPLRFQPGTRLTFGRILGVDNSNRQHSFEFTYLGLFNWSNEYELVASVQDNNVLNIALQGDPIQVDQNRPDFVLAGNEFAGFIPGFTQMQVQSFRHEASYDSFEVNMRLTGRPARDRVALQPDGTWVRHASASRINSAVAGLRIVKVDELGAIQSRLIESDLAAGDYNVRLNNFMAGMQIGGQFVERYHGWSWGVRGKIGGLLNFAKRRSDLEGFSTLSDQDGNSFVINIDNQEDVNDEHLAIMAEGGVFLAYEIRPNAAIRLGYDAMYLTGIAATVPNLSIADSFRPLNLEGDALYHGLSAGLEVFW